MKYSNWILAPVLNRSSWDIPEGWLLSLCTGVPLLSGDVINDAGIKEKRLSAPFLSRVLMCRSCYALIMDTYSHYYRCLPRNQYKPVNQHWHCAVVWHASEWENSTVTCSVGCLRTWELGLGEPEWYPIVSAVSQDMISHSHASCWFLSDK